jgi:hypothetical protein
MREVKQVLVMMAKMQGCRVIELRQV